MEIVDKNTQMEQGTEQVSDRIDRLISRQSLEIVKSHKQGKKKKPVSSNKKGTNAHLKKSHSMAMATLESIESGVLVTDFDGNIVLFNNNFAKMWGLDGEMLSTMNEDNLLSYMLRQLADPIDFLFVVKQHYLYPTVKSHDILRLENGTILERSSQPQLVDGKNLGMVWSFRDITERMLAEEKLENHNRQLVKTTAELDRFVYSASRELRAPLISVLGLISISRMSENDAIQTRILDMMQTSIESLDIFIKDIVNYSGNSRLNLKMEKIDLEATIDECFVQLHYMPEIERVSMFTEINGDHDFYSDPRRVTVLLQNLLSNAIKFQNSDQEKPCIHLAVNVGPEVVDITIIDNGAGIALEYQNRIFNMFYGANEKKSGTGLGLYIVKEILDRLGGTIRLESELGVGSTFFVSIPNSPSS